jgi:hypothetical protein
MKSLIRKITLMLSAFLVSGGLTFAVAAVPAHAQLDPENPICKGVALTGPDDSCEDTGEGKDSFSTVIKNVINIFSIVVGAVSVIMIIVGGFRYVISNGDSNGVSGAKNTILYAIVGLVIVLFAQVIVRFVLTNLSKPTT